MRSPKPQTDPLPVVSGKPSSPNVCGEPITRAQERGQPPQIGLVLRPSGTRLVKQFQQIPPSPSRIREQRAGFPRICSVRPVRPPTPRQPFRRPRARALAAVEATPAVLHSRAQAPRLPTCLCAAPWRVLGDRDVPASQVRPRRCMGFIAHFFDRPSGCANPQRRPFPRRAPVRQRPR
jgi:hypothetical protein